MEEKIKEKESKKVGILSLLLILAIIVIIVMGYFMYNLYNGKGIGISENNKVSLNGIYLENPNSTDVIYEFMDNSFVEVFSNNTTKQGYYSTVGENEIEILLLKETVSNVDTGEATVTKINEIIKVKVNDTTLNCEGEINGEKISFELYQTVN